MDNWIEKLKVGDKVLVHDNLLPVEKVHKIHVVVAGTKYRKNGGYPVGEWRYGLKRIEEATPERIAESADKKARRAAISRIERQNLNWCSTETLQKIVDILDAEKDGENG